MMKRKEIDARRIFSSWRRAIEYRCGRIRARINRAFEQVRHQRRVFGGIAATQVLLGVAAAVSIVLANVPTGRSEALSVSDRTGGAGASIQVAALRDEANSSLPTSSRNLFKIKVTFNDEPDSPFFLAGYEGEVLRVAIGRRAWGIVCQINHSGRASVEILKLEGLLDTNQQFIDGRFINLGQSIFGAQTSGMSSAPFRIELEGIQKRPTTTSGHLRSIGSDWVLRAGYVPGSLRNESTAAYSPQIGQQPECCVTCSGIRVCGCAVEAPCGSCCSGSCCDSASGQTDPGDGRFWMVDVGSSVEVDYKLTIKLLQLAPTIVLEVTSPDLPKAKQLEYLGKASMVLVVGESRFELTVVEATKTGVRFRVRRDSKAK